MNWVTAAWGAVKGVFGGSSSGKSMVETTAEIADNYMPGEVTKHKMEIEEVKVGYDSQKSAREWEYTGSENSGIFNQLIDGLNRLPRPLFALWAFGILSGLIDTPASIAALNPVVANIIWTIIGFYFGIRTVSQDLPKAIDAWLKMRSLI